MTPRTGPVTDSEEIVRCALLSALRRRGLAPWEEPTSGAVTVGFGYRTVTVQLTNDGWVRHIPQRPDTPVRLAGQGAEEALARQLARELLDRLP